MNDRDIAYLDGFLAAIDSMQVAFEQAGARLVLPDDIELDGKQFARLLRVGLSTVLDIAEAQLNK